MELSEDGAIWIRSDKVGTEMAVCYGLGPFVILVVPPGFGGSLDRPGDLGKASTATPWGACIQAGVPGTTSLPRVRMSASRSSPGTRVRCPSIRWSHVDFLGHDFGQFIPFAINWLDSTHPSRTAPGGATLEGVSVEHPRANELRKIYQALGIPAEVIQAENPRIVVLFQGKNGPFQLTSGSSLLAYYAARGVKNIK